MISYQILFSMSEEDIIPNFAMVWPNELYNYDWNFSIYFEAPHGCWNITLYITPERFI